MGSWERFIGGKGEKALRGLWLGLSMQLFCVALWSILCVETTFIQSFCLAPPALTSCSNLPNEQFGQNYSSLATNCWMFKCKTCNPTQPTFYQSEDDIISSSSFCTLENLRQGGNS